MGFIRGILIVLVSVILFLSLLVTGFFVTISSSLTYENVQLQFYPIANQILEEQIGIITIVDTLSPYLNEYCNENFEVVQDFQGYTFVFPCEIIAAGENSMLEYGINYFIKDFYYKEYSCEFWSCFQEQEIPLFLVSEYAHNYWKNWFFKAFLISLILSLGLIILSKRKSNGFFLTGILLILTSFIVLKLDKIGSFIANLIVSPISSALTEETTSAFLPLIINIFFSNSNRVFVWMFIIAIILIIIGILFRLFRIGFKISNLFRRIKEKEFKEDKEQDNLEKKVKDIKDKNQNKDKLEKKEKEVVENKEKNTKKSNKEEVKFPNKKEVKFPNKKEVKFPNKEEKTNKKKKK